VAEWIPAADNLYQIKKAGLNIWLKEQAERQTLLEELLENYNEGRSMSFYCKACARMPVDLIKNAIQAVKENVFNESDIKLKAKAMKISIQNLAAEANVHLD